jgi:hypothetical protein
MKIPICFLFSSPQIAQAAGPGRSAFYKGVVPRCFLTRFNWRFVAAGELFQIVPPANSWIKAQKMTQFHRKWEEQFLSTKLKIFKKMALFHEIKAWHLPLPAFTPASRLTDISPKSLPGPFCHVPLEIIHFTEHFRPWGVHSRAGCCRPAKLMTYIN